jgi:hypothetical protein
VSALSLAGGAVVGGVWKVSAVALAILLLVVTAGAGTGWWLTAAARDEALASLKAEQGASTALRASIGVQNEAVESMQRATAQAQARGNAARAAAATAGRRLDAAQAKLAGARATTCNEAMPFVDQTAKGCEMRRTEQQLSIFRNFAGVTFAALLAGCGTTSPATQIIEVPVYTSCVKATPARPVYEFNKLPLDAPDGAKILALARDWLRGQQYQNQLEAIIQGCHSIPAS